MQETKRSKMAFIDGSLLIIESIVKAGGDVYIGYPITPANLLYLYSSKLFKFMLPAPDEITTLQWMSGFAATGKIPVTATSFPGLALMVESINMAYMMELPMVIILSQRLGPSTGTATCGAQGDLSLINGMVSGGSPIPTLCPSNYNDCWELGAESVRWAWEMKTPVILLTSKEMIMTLQSFDISALKPISKIKKEFYNKEDVYKPYLPKEDLSREFLPVGNDKFMVRITASTHDSIGMLQHSTPDSINNTKRLQEKLIRNLKDFTFYELDEEKGAKEIIVSYGITAKAAREAVNILRKQGKKISLLILKTIFPLPNIYFEIMEKYTKVIIAEENLNGQMKQIMFGEARRKNIISVTKISKLITPLEIIQGVNQQ